jgi:hypothetical protein
MTFFAATPQPLGTYSRFMMDSFQDKNVVSVKTGFQAFFGRQDAGGRTRFNPDAAVFDYDIIRGNRRLGALVPRGMDSRDIGSRQKNTKAQRYSSTARIMPLGEEEGDIQASQLLLRQAGESEEQAQTRLDRMRSLAADHHDEHVRRLVRTMEYLAAQSIITGTMPTLLGTVASDKVFDWRRSTGNTYSVPTVWTDPAADIFGNIDYGCDKVDNVGLANPDMIVFSSSAIDAFLQDSDVAQKSDNRRWRLMEVNERGFMLPDRFQRFVEGGFKARGYLQTPDGYELYMFTCNYKYDDDTGTAQKYLPDGTVIICDSQARYDRIYGPPEVLPDISQRREQMQQLFGMSQDNPQMPANIAGLGSIVPMEAFYFDAYMPANWKSATIRTQISPVFVPVQTDAVMTLTDVTT